MANGMAYLIGRMLLGTLRISTSVLLATPAGTKAPTWVTFSAAWVILLGHHEYVTSILRVPDTPNTSRNGIRCT